MIHSLAGGEIKEKKLYTFVKVEILSAMNEGYKFWYLSDLIDIKVGDKVIVPLRGERKEGTIERVETNVTSDRAPIPINRAKYILRKIK